MEPRPIIALPLSPAAKGLEKGCVVLLSLLWIGSAIAFLHLPEIIPIHFNASGKVDGFGTKKTLFLLPLVATVLYIALSFLNKYPHHFNYTVTINQTNAAQQYRIATSAIRMIKFSVLLLFTTLVLLTYLTATGTINGLGKLFLPVAVALLFIPVVWLLAQSQKKA